MTRRGRPAKPVSKHKHEGTYRPDRHGARAEVEETQAKAKDIPAKPPAHLNAETQAAWLEIREMALDVGVDIRAADTFVVEAAAVALVAARNAQATIDRIGSVYYESRYGISLHPAARERKSSWAAFHQSCSLLGLSPLDREKIASGDGGADDDGEGLDNIYQLRRPADSA